MAALLKFVHGGEYHMYNPDVIATLQAAVNTGDYSLYQNFANIVNTRPASTLRVPAGAGAAQAQPIPVDEVESEAAIISRSSRLRRHVAGRVVARGARGAGHRDEPARRAFELG